MFNDDREYQSCLIIMIVDKKKIKKVVIVNELKKKCKELTRHIIVSWT